MYLIQDRVFVGIKFKQNVLKKLQKFSKLILVVVLKNIKQFNTKT